MVNVRGGRTSSEERVVNRKECCDLIVQALDRHLTIPIQGTLTQKRLFQGLAGMAASNQSIHSASYTLTNVPCETSFRYHLNKLDIVELERINNSILTYSIQDVLKRGTAYQFAIDITHVTTVIRVHVKMMFAAFSFNLYQLVTLKKQGFI